MKRLKNISVGFLVSFLGSIPLGYLNLAGLEIYSKSGLHNLVLFLFGVVFVETFVIYFTLLFAKQLVRNKKLMKFIDLFSVAFLFVLAFVFYLNFNQPAKPDNQLRQYMLYSPFVIGVVLNCLNFLQLPFWTSWNLYLLNQHYITPDGKLKYYYIAGTLVGIFLGMFSLIIVLQTVFQQINQFSKYILPVFIPLFFIAMGIIQLFKVYKKYFKSAVVF
ncbi:LysE family transporter [Flavobacterium sp. 1355]|uniref:LysE family transporter n=1 Tax=Flavobacterium sp. 1355 TaxID=2806571 RepID=UPI001AE5CE9D|nr:LysE family transporter [Flavobacterium sp. 1355]MBP1222387.1 F0F1-type ATP synthase membrane subunit c/vacuolar-type H+-ATPase subunit K [Flavobacterium sp. 1355]